MKCKNITQYQKANSQFSSWGEKIWPTFPGPPHPILPAPNGCPADQQEPGRRKARKRHIAAQPGRCNCKTDFQVWAEGASWAILDTTCPAEQGLLSPSAPGKKATRAVGHPGPSRPRAHDGQNSTNPHRRKSTTYGKRLVQRRCWAVRAVIKSPRTPCGSGLELAA